MLVKNITSALSYRFMLACLFTLLCFQTFASTWVRIHGDLFIPLPEFTGVEVQNHYTNGVVTANLNNVGQSTVVYYQPQRWQNGAFDETAPWQCDDQPSLTGDDWTVTVNNLSDGMYRLKAAVTMVQTSCQISDFEAGNLVSSEQLTSQPFMLVDNVDISLAKLEQRRTDRYDIHAFWPTAAGADSYKLGLSKDNVWHYFDISATDYQNAVINSNGWEIIDIYDNATETYPEYTGFGDYKMSVSYCFDDLCSLPLSNPATTLSVPPTTDFTLMSAAAVTNQYAATIEFQTDSRTPKFEIHRFVEFPGTSQPFISGVLPISLPDAQTIYNVTNNGAHFRYNRTIPLEHAGRHELRIRPCTNEGVCNDWVSFGPFFDVASSLIKIAGGFDSFNPQQNRVSGWVSDNDTHPEKIRLYYNGNYITGTETATTTGPETNKRYFAINNINTLLTNAGINIDDPFSIELRALDWPSNTLYRPVETLHVNQFYNSAPVANSDAVFALDSQPININVLANDSDPDGNQLNLKDYDLYSSSGVALSNYHNYIVYTPNPNLGVDVDTFAYSNQDEHGQWSNTTTVSVIYSSVMAVYDEAKLISSASSASASASKFNRSTIQYSVDIDVLANDQNLQNLPVTVEIVSQPTQGTVTVDSNNIVNLNVVGVPIGPICIEYQIVTEAGSRSNLAKACGFSDDYLPNTDSYNVAMNSTTHFDVLDNDKFNAPKSYIEISLDTTGTEGTVSVFKNNNGFEMVRYTAPTDVVGNDSFTYSVTGFDGNEVEGPISVTVAIGENTPFAPTGLTATATGDESIDVSFNASNNSSSYHLQQFMSHTDIASSTINDNSWSPVVATTALQRQYNLDGLTSGYYYYRVKACSNNATTCSSWRVTSNSTHLSNSNTGGGDGGGATQPDTESSPDTTWPTTQDAISAAVGTVGGSFRVSESGSATYQVPISIPEGIAGVTPEVSIGYNSFGGNGIMGMGWQLNTGSAIARCRQTFEADDKYQAITLTNDDRFCLNGQRLVPVAGNNGADSTVYKTEVDSQQRITSHGTEGNGPAYFTVEGPDGSISYYGDYDSYTTGSIAADDNTIVTWLQVRTEDNMGRINTSNSNIIEYFYQHLADNEVLLDYIDYSDNQVDFSYSTRNDTALSYAAGLAMASTQRLNTITVKNHLNQAISSYHMDYTPQNYAANDNTRLHSITQCDGNSNGTCKLPTTFEWNESYTPVNTTTTDSFDVSDVKGTFPLDINGDGKVDIAVLDKNSSQSYMLKFMVNSGNTDFTTTNAPSSIYISHSDTASLPIVTPIDTNGDGVSELAIRYRSTGNNQFYWKLYTLSGGSYGSSTLLSNIHSASFTDLTGDGLVDLLYRDKVNNVFENMLRINNGNGFDTAVIMPTPTPPVSSAELDIKFDLKSLKEKGQHRLIEADSSEEQALISSNYLGKISSDFNGDGLADIVTVTSYLQSSGAAGEPGCKQDTYIKRSHIYTSEQSIDAQNISEFSLNHYGTLPGETWVIDSYPAIMPSTREIIDACNTADTNLSLFNGGQRVVDLNGDGMTDVIYRHANTGIWYVSYSTGIDFTAPVTPTNMTGDIVNISYVDVDADGDIDLLYTIKPDSSDTKATHNWYMHENDNGTLLARSNFLISAVHLNFDAYHESMMFMDVNGDGESERVIIDYQDKSKDITVIQTYAKSRHSRIETIIDGLGNQTTIDYEPLTNNTVYTKGTGAETLNYGQGSPVFDAVTPMHVVSQVTSSAPGYDSTGTTYNADSTISVQYAYQGLRMQTGGRGSLGFDTIISYDPQSGITSETNYRQDFPYIGMPTRTLQCLDKGLSSCDGASRPLSTSLNFYNDSVSTEPDTLHDDAVYVAYPYRQLTDSYQLKSDGTTTFINRTENYTYKSEVTAGGYLQVDSTNTIIFGTASSSGTPLSFTTTQNTYGKDNETNWWINRVTATEVTQGKSGQTSIVRNASFVYDTTTGLLIEEYIEPNSSDVSLYLKTVHTYDTLYGNKLTTTQCSLGNVTSSGCAKASTDLAQVYRHASHVYDANGRYVTSTGNDLFNDLSTIDTRNELGQVTQSHNIDGVNSHAIYDSFGQIYASKNDAGQFKKVTNRLAADKPASWPFIDEPYSIVTQVIEAGKPVAYSYADRRGLTVATVTQGFADNAWIVQYNRYDKHGKSVKQSMPFHYGNTIYWSSNQYDIMNRPVSSTTADGNTTATITYNGLTTSTTSVSDSSDYNTITTTSSKTTNRIGETVTVTDNLNKTISYNYDVTGKLDSTTTNGTTTNITHDDYGRKTQMNDPDKGVWTYQYNALGELIEQTDANGQTIRTYRDSIGRTTYEYIVKTENETETFVDQVNNVYSGHQLVEQNRNSNNYRRCMYYDSFGRNTQTTSIFDNRACPSIAPTSSVALKMYNQSTHFDTIGRVLTQYDATGQGVTNHYKNGYLYKQVEASNSSLHMEILTMDAMGNITRSKDGLNVETSKVYHPANGLIQSLITDNGGIQHITYAFDGVGNMRNRNNINSNINQDFRYDDLNRLTHVDDFMPQNVHYDDNGNIFSKSDVRNGATYSYNSSRPHAVTHIGSASYAYDDNGNQTRATDNTGYVRNVDYNYFDKPTAITMGDEIDSDYTNFKYDSSNNRYQRIDAITNSDTNTQEVTTTYYIGNVEVSQVPSGTVFVKRYVANAIQTVGNNGTNSTRYTYKDHLGSLDAIVTPQKYIESKLYFDPWGKRTALSKGQLSAVAQARSVTTLIDSLVLTTRGFTGHESIDHTGIIHMNGRIYDPSLGRFLQADPFVQAPNNTQSYNRYSYVINNPLKYTDPSGYIFDSVFKYVNQNLGDFAPIAAIAFGIIAGPWAAANMWNAAVVGFISGGIASGSLKGAMLGALSGAAFHQIGSHFNKLGAQNLNDIAWNGANLNDFIDFGGNYLTSGQVSGQIASHAVAGGVISTLGGGKFGHGFFSAGVTKGLGGAYLPSGSNLSTNEVIQGTVASAVIGGTSSVISGGKFSNGARTATYQYLFNQVSKAIKNRKQAVKSAINHARSIYSAGTKHGNRLSGHTIGTYVYKYKDGSIRFDLVVSTAGAAGSNVQNGAMGGYSSPNIKSLFFTSGDRQVTDWIIAENPNNRSLVNQFDKAVKLGAENIYKINMDTKQIYHHTYNKQSKAWSCTIYESNSSC